MSQTYFGQIKKYYHMAAPDTPTYAATGHNLWHSKVVPLLDQLCYNSQYYQMPSTHTTIDEYIIRATERFQHTYKMASKSILL